MGTSLHFTFTTSWVGGRQRRVRESRGTKNRPPFAPFCNTLRGFGTERARLGTFRGFGTERERLGAFRGLGTERARLGAFRGLGTERARLGPFKALALIFCGILFK